MADADPDAELRAALAFPGVVEVSVPTSASPTYRPVVVRAASEPMRPNEAETSQKTSKKHPTFVTLQEYVAQHKTAIRVAASRHGAVLFTGFDVKSGEEFASVLSKSGLEPAPYVGGAAVRKLIVGREEEDASSSSSNTKPPTFQIVTTNESPPSEPIPFHHELAQSPSPPDVICFFCVENQALNQKGATPISRSDDAYDWLRATYPDFVDALEEKQGVKYVKVAPGVDDASSALGRSWRNMFGVESKEEAERAMRAQKYAWEWLNDKDDCCRITSPTLPAVRTASNGRKALFNQIVAAYNGWIDKRNDPKKAVVFADGSPLPSDILDALTAHLAKTQFSHAWAAGDWLYVDNTVACHSREPFELSGGRRRVLAAIAKDKEESLKLTKTPSCAATEAVVALSSGDLLPSVGLGCWKLDKEVAANVVYEAIKIGYRLIDSAADYGNEEATGLGIKRALDEGVCQRSELFVVSKLWNTFHAHVDEGLRKSLNDLQLDYVDLYLIHFPLAQRYVPISTRYPPEWFYDPDAATPRMEFDDSVTYEQTWRAMERQVDAGLARNIGCCNIGTTMLRQVLTYSRVRPAVLQVEMHPYNTQHKLLKFARSLGVQVMAFSNLASASYVELGMATENDSLLAHPVITNIAAAAAKTSTVTDKVTPAQVLLRWGVQRGTVVIPKTSKVDRLKENLALFDFRLDDADMAAIDALDAGRRFNDPGHFCELAFHTFCPIYE